MNDYFGLGILLLCVVFGIWTCNNNDVIRERIQRGTCPAATP
jgi:hypothetical protein